MPTATPLPVLQRGHWEKCVKSRKGRDTQWFVLISWWAACWRETGLQTPQPSLHRKTSCSVEFMSRGPPGAVVAHEVLGERSQSLIMTERKGWWKGSPHLFARPLGFSLESFRWGARMNVEISCGVSELNSSHQRGLLTWALQASGPCSSSFQL